MRYLQEEYICMYIYTANIVHICMYIKSMYTYNTNNCICRQKTIKIIHFYPEDKNNC